MRSGPPPMATPPPAGHGESYLSELGYTVNAELHIVICRDCMQWVQVESIWSHASRVHASRFQGGRKLDPERLATDIRRFGLEQGEEKIRQYLEVTDTLKDPIEGLPVEEGYMCTQCVFYSAKLTTMKKHASEHHKEGCGDPPGEHRARCSVQRLSLRPSPGARGGSWFGVTTPCRAAPAAEEGGGSGVSASTRLLFDIITEEARAREEEVLEAPHRDPRQVPMFVKVLHWDVFLENLNLDVAQVAPLLAARRACDARFFPDRLELVCWSLMGEFQSTLADAETLLRKKVRSTNPANLSPGPFSRLEQSYHDYVGELVHLLLRLLRSLDGHDAGERGGEEGTSGEAAVWPILLPLEPGVRRSVRRLWDGLGAASADGRYPDEELEESKVHCHRVLEALFFVVRPSHAVPEASLPVFRFVVLGSIKAHRVLVPDDVTHRISRMMYWCRLLVLCQIVHHPVDPEAGGDDVAQVEARFLSYVREDQRTPFAAMLEAKRLVRAVAKNEPVLPKVIWAGDDQIVDGVRVSIADVTELVRRSIRELYQGLEEDLLLGMPEYHANRGRILCNRSGGPLEDNLHDYRNGHWFVSNPNNLCSGLTLGLVLHIARTPGLRGRFIESATPAGEGSAGSGGSGGGIAWKADALTKWLGAAGKWLEKLMTVVHLVAGQPARGVELLACSTRNTTTQVRGVYIVEGLVMLLTLYGKADNVRGSQVPIARFLCKDTSFLLINYLTYVREMEVVAAKALYGAGGAATYGRLLAVKGGQPMTSRDLTNGIARAFLEHRKVSVTLAPWRHMAVAWMHRFLRYTNVLELTGNGVVDSQAGHSQRLASKCYGRSNFDHPSIGRDEFQLYRWVSVEWHKVLGLRTDPAGPNLDDVASVGFRGPSTSPDPVHGSASPSCPPSSGPGNHPSPPGPRGPGARGAVARSPPATPTAHPQQHQQQHHHHHHHEVKVVRCAGDVGIDRPSLTCSKQAVSGLAALGHVGFRSPHQAEAVHRVLERQEDLLVVLPTGGGKTLLFLLPAVVERGRHTTVVICPFVALRNEMESRARKAGLSVQVYSESGAPDGADLLLVSVEHCTSPSFQSHLASLHAQDRLGRIVLDECHVALVDSTWRPMLHGLRYVRKAPVPLLLLSATVPPDMEVRMKHFFKSQFSVIRCPTTRPNLRYEARRVQAGPGLAAGLLAVLSSGPGTPKSIVFSRGKSETEEMAAALRGRGIAAVHYHADLDAQCRNAAHGAWTRGEADVMVATGAFGAGIDSPAVRLVVHLEEPYSMIHLAQESGRGGRDGSPSKHIVLLSRPRSAQAGACPKMAEYLGGAKCRRRVLQEYVDGVGSDCFASASEACDVCESLLRDARSGLPAAHRFGEPSGHSSSSESVESPRGSGYMDLSSSAASDTSAMRDRCGPPAKRMRIGDALMTESAERTRDSHADLRLVTLALMQYLAGVKGRCIVCSVVEEGVPDYEHELGLCPRLKGLCLKCQGSDGHRAKECPNKLHFKTLGCYGCGLPKKLGAQVLHPEPFEGGCKSMGNDKLIPACWYMWRHAAWFHELFVESGCPPHLEDPQFAAWLAGAHEEYGTNVLALFLSYVRRAG